MYGLREIKILSLKALVFVDISVYALSKDKL